MRTVLAGDFKRRLGARQIGEVVSGEMVRCGCRGADLDAGSVLYGPSHAIGLHGRPRITSPHPFSD